MLRMLSSLSESLLMPTHPSTSILGQSLQNRNFVLILGHWYWLPSWFQTAVSDVGPMNR